MARRGDGLYLRGKTWYLDCCINGTRYQRRLGKGITRSVALELAQVQRGAILRGNLGIGKKAKDLTFDEARKKFEGWATANKRPRTVTSYKECLRRLAESFSGQRLSQISPFVIERHKQARVQAGARVRCNREISVLKNLFNYCRGQKLYEGDNPANEVKLLKEPTRRLRVLEPEEEQQLIADATSPLQELIIVAINTGLRIGAEALPLRWPDIDFRRALLTVQAAYAKNGTTRSIPLNERAYYEALTKLKEQTKGEFVFTKVNGKPYDSMGKPFSRPSYGKSALRGPACPCTPCGIPSRPALSKRGWICERCRNWADGRTCPWCSGMPMSGRARRRTPCVGSAKHSTALFPTLGEPAKRDEAVKAG